MRSPARAGTISGATHLRRAVRVDVVLGVLGALVMAGPLLRPGAVLDLDFVLLPHAPLPNGFWGLGPELPRRIPEMLPITWLGGVIGSVPVGKAMVVACLAAMFVGATRLAVGVGAPWCYAAGLLYAFGPFATTRMVVGHLFVLAAMAVLPFALPTLLHPTVAPRRTFLWASALALTGFLGGVFAVSCVSVGAARHGARGVQVVAASIAAQAPWLVPGLIVLWQGSSTAGARPFRPDVHGLAGLASIASGHGFWQASLQVGWSSAWVLALTGVGMLVLAASGRHALQERLPRLDLLAVGALVVVVAAALRPTRPVIEALTELPGGATVRETQRLLPLFLVWAAPAVAAGAQRLASTFHGWRADAGRAAAVSLGLLLLAPGVWGGGGRIDPVAIPAEWDRVRDIVRAEPGTTLVLPFFLYLDLDVAGGRRVLNPMPLFLGGDVLVSSDPRLPDGPGLERADPREPFAAAAIARNLGGGPMADDLAAIGVRWIVVMADGGLLRGRPLGALHDEAVQNDPKLRHVLDGEVIDLYEVQPWAGSLTSAGRQVEMEPVVGPFARAGPSGVAVYARPWAAGWMRGFSLASESPGGMVSLPAGRGLVWYWPSALVVLSYLLSIGAVLRCYFSKDGNQLLGH